MGDPADRGLLQVEDADTVGGAVPQGLKKLDVVLEASESRDYRPPGYRKPELAKVGAGAAWQEIWVDGFEFVAYAFDFEHL